MSRRQRRHKKKLKLVQKYPHWLTMCSPFTLAPLRMQKVSATFIDDPLDIEIVMPYPLPYYREESLLRDVVVR